MPLASSYLEGNDYQVLKRLPYRLNVNDIAKTLAVKSAYWNIGAERVKSRYMDALGLDVTNPENQRILKDYVQNSEKMIKSLSSQDLSNPDVQEQGINIFKPLFKDEGIMYDDQYTKHLKKVRADYYTQLKKDPSKANSTNLAYALEDEEKFRNDPDRASAKGYYQKRKDYTPFYDATSEIATVMKHCKQDSIVSQAPKEGTLYFDKTENKSLSEEKVAACFQAGLSDRARQQFRITGYMALKDNKDALAKEYVRSNSLGIQRVHSDLAEIAKQEAKLLKKKSLGTITKDELSSLQNLQQTAASYRSEVDNYKSINNRLIKNDYSDLDKDLENIAGNIYTQAKISQFGKAFSFTDFSQKFIENPVEMLKARQTFELQEQMRDQTFQFEKQRREHAAQETLEALKAMNKGTGGAGGAQGAVTYNPVTKQYEPSGSIVPGSNIEEEAGEIGNFKDFEKDIKTTSDAIAANDQYLAQRMLDNDPIFLSTIGSLPIAAGILPAQYNGITYAQMLTKVKNGEIKVDLHKFGNLVDYLKDNSDTKADYNTWLGANLSLQAKKAIINEKSLMLESQIPIELRDGSRNTRLNSIAPKTLTIDGQQITVTARDIQAALEGKANPAGLEITNRASMISVGPMGTGEMNQREQIVPRFKINGKDITNDKVAGVLGLFLPNSATAKAHDELMSLHSSVFSVDSDRIRKLNEKRTALYSNKGWANANFFSVSSDDKADNMVTLRSQLDNTIADDDTKQKIQILGTDYMGAVKVYLPGKGKSDVDDIRTKIGGIAGTPLGTDVSIKKTADDGTFIISGLPTFDYSKVFGISRPMLDLGIHLKTISTNLAVGESRKIPLPVMTGRNIKQVQDMSLEVINTPGGPSYRLLDVNGEELAEQSDPFSIMKKADVLQKTLR